MKKLNKRGYLTIEIILGSVIAFAIAFFLIEITVKMVSNNDDTFRDTIITTDNALIISGVKSEIESIDTGISKIECNNNICNIKYADNSNGKLYIYISKDDNLKKNKIVYEMNNVITYQKELDSSLSDIKLTSNITGDGEVTDKSNIYFKITGKNIFLDKEYNIIIPIDNLLRPKTLVEYITNLYNVNTKTTVTNNEITYNTAPSVNLMNDRLGNSSTDIDGGNIRYYGADPNNYIYFNCSDYSNQTSDTCETWRIIGVFEVETPVGNGNYKKEKKVKIMRGSTIGNYSWDNKDKTTGAEDDYGKNDWTDARLMKLLNPGYESETTGGSLYYNSGSGSCYSGQKNATTTCDFTSTGIKNDTTRNLISDTLYYLGGWEDSYSVYSDQIYGYERGTTVYTGRPTTWTGKIALAYLSDYGYAADLGSCTKNLVHYDTTCESTNWMKPIFTGTSWLLTPGSASSNYAWYVDLLGCYTNNTYIAIIGGAPVLYLSPGTLVKTGDGSSSNPLQILTD